MDPNVAVCELDPRKARWGTIYLRDLIEKGERYDALKAHADKLADALEDSNREVHGDENMDIWFAGKEALARYRDFTKEQP